MQEVDINTFFYKKKPFEGFCLKENIPNNIILTGKITRLNINYIYIKLDLSKIKCNKLYYYKQQGESIKNHILPSSLKELCCSNNKLTSLPNLPNSLQNLYCSNNQLKLISDGSTSLPHLRLPDSLEYLSCSNNKLISLPQLPNSLKELICGNNQLISLPQLPNSLKELICGNNQLTSLPILPNSLFRVVLGDSILNKLEYNPDYKNIKFYLYNTKIRIGDYIIESEEDYISYMEDYEKYLFNKVKSARN